jgi:hypothetical protein
MLSAGGDEALLEYASHELIDDQPAFVVNRASGPTA